jgi:hypothetical protein
VRSTFPFGIKSYFRNPHHSLPSLRIIYSYASNPAIFRIICYGDFVQNHPFSSSPFCKSFSHPRTDKSPGWQFKPCVDSLDLLLYLSNKQILTPIYELNVNKKTDNVYAKPTLICLEFSSETFVWSILQVNRFYS